jgi:acyl carrier protein
MSLRDDLLATIAGWNLPLEPADDTPLIGSGLLDSLALFNLVLWVEEKTGSPVDPTQFDLPREWDTVAGIVAFVERRRSRAQRRDPEESSPGRG